MLGKTEIKELPLDTVVLVGGLYSYFVHGRFININLSAAIATVAVFFYTLLSLSSLKRNQIFWTIKLVLLLITISTTIGSGLFYQMQERLLTYSHNRSFVHDHPLQIEAATKFLIAGSNPYSANYKQTPLAKWWPGNPAIDHVISLPFTILKSVPVMLVWEKMFGWYDDRISHLLLFILALVSLYGLFNHPQLRLLAMSSFAFNPLFINFFIEGRSDIVFLSLILFSLMSLKYNYLYTSLIFLAFAITSKHTAWFILPFYWTYLWRQGYLKEKALLKISVFLLVIAAIVLPFAASDWQAFVTDVYDYPAGTLPDSYFINGFNLGMTLVNHDLIKKSDYFPFGLIQAPLLLLLGWFLWKQRSPSLSRLVFNYALFLWPYWWLSRFFNDNYPGVIVFLLVLGTLLSVEEERADLTHLP